MPRPAPVPWAIGAVVLLFMACSRQASPPQRSPHDAHASANTGEHDAEGAPEAALAQHTMDNGRLANAKAQAATSSGGRESIATENVSEKVPDDHHLASDRDDSTPPRDEHQMATAMETPLKRSARTPATRVRHTKARSVGDSKQGEKPRVQPHGERKQPIEGTMPHLARRSGNGEKRQPPTPSIPPAGEILAPSVSMSHEHRKSCLVYIGDSMPDGTLSDQEGTPRSILESLGKRLTAIVFWNTKNPYALEQFEQLEHELLPFKQWEVQTIAIHVGPESSKCAQLCQRVGQGVRCLSDPDQAYFGAIASGSVPRTYLLNAEGEVVWLDIEYSCTTRHDLRNALFAFLRHGEEAVQPQEPEGE